MIVLPEPWHLPWPDGLPAEAAMASGSLAASRGHFCDSAVSFLFPGPHIFLFLDLLHCFGEECRLVLAWKRVLRGIFFTLQKFVCPPAYLISTWMFLRHFKDDTFKWRAWFLPSSQPNSASLTCDHTQCVALQKSRSNFGSFCFTSPPHLTFPQPYPNSGSLSPLPPAWPRLLSPSVWTSATVLIASCPVS